MKRLAATLSAAALLATFSLAAHADDFSQVQNNPNTYWVPAPASGSNNSAPVANSAPSSDPKQMQAPASQPPPQQAPPQGYYYPAPRYVVAPPPGYYPPPGYVYAAPPPGYYAPRPYYYGPPAAVSYVGGPHGGRVFVGLPGLFLGFHFH